LAVHGEGVLDSTPAPQSYTVIDIDFWGTISNDYGGPRVGEAIEGSMRLDLRFAGADHEYWSPNWGVYGVNYPPCERNCPEPEPDRESRFVTTRGGLVEGQSYDEVTVVDSIPGSDSFPHDYLRVQDWEWSGLPSDDSDADLRVVVGISSSVVDFIHGDGLLQPFDLRLADAGGDTAGGGIWQQLVNGVSSGFEFALDRIRVTPKVCRI
jgi:hypothetical protein